MTVIKSVEKSEFIHFGNVEFKLKCIGCKSLLLFGGLFRSTNWERGEKRLKWEKCQLGFSSHLLAKDRRRLQMP